MQKHIFQPIPDLNRLQRPITREDRLKTILANLEKHEQDVKKSIVAGALQKLQTARQKATDTDTTTIDHDQQPLDHGRLPSNLRAPYRQGSGDPCMPYIDPRRLAEADAAEQARADPQLAAVLEAVAQLREYETCAGRAKEPYIKALERQRAQQRAGW
ncbi:hypothetical protein KC367_g8092 [Hortaea werneckii]|uniref:Uncharacterized protein n=2 Tax=Hortaea werneckii TaxID=91943 RepID=A0A3M7IIH5_HORWE|nr:hypothetical protein KC342_g4426 [Hortaea werneckii]OTA24434.1 hypothetical protein BTJ68_12854 [Hortaea werneckii EXF-2000]KAI6844666.1 hypothetical protein KC358_g3677 [Hortaea werneckii]KAI6848433.1 hypothetical protein KC350_g3019 [Hortaea werneckii]KAI6940411.1 hypothetical protein KC341_g3539 [Hortaea werneckii]